MEAKKIKKNFFFKCSRMYITIKEKSLNKDVPVFCKIKDDFIFLKLKSHRQQKSENWKGSCWK